jgi:hypothetical protein
MRDWGPALASVGVRRLDATRARAVGLPIRARRCVVTLSPGYLRRRERCPAPARVRHGICADRSRTWTCALNRFGAYTCPPRHETDFIRLRNENATMSKHGVLKLDFPLHGTHPPRRLAWQRYPRADGYVEPWTRSGKLRPGLRLVRGYSEGGSCDPSFSSEETPQRNAIRCLWRGIYQVDPCFAPPGRWNHRGGFVACSYGAGATPFGAELGEPSAKGAKDLRGDPLVYQQTQWRVTAKAGRLYVTFFEEPRAPFALPAIRNKVTRAYRLADKAPVDMKMENGRAVLNLERPIFDPMATVVVIEFEGNTVDRVR